jgi:predicted metal-binding protein
MAKDTSDSQTPAKAPVLLTICTTCKREGVDPEATRPGTLLLEALKGTDLPDGVSVRGVECLSACKRGCSMVLSGGADRWSYIYGDLDPDQHVPEILEGAAAYAATEDGLVPWRARPQVFRKQSIARIPPAAAPGDSPSQE